MGEAVSGFLGHLTKPRRFGGAPYHFLDWGYALTLFLVALQADVRPWLQCQWHGYANTSNWVRYEFHTTFAIAVAHGKSISTRLSIYIPVATISELLELLAAKCWYTKSAEQFD